MYGVDDEMIRGCMIGSAIKVAIRVIGDHYHDIRLSWVGARDSTVIGISSTIYPKDTLHVERINVVIITKIGESTR